MKRACHMPIQPLQCYPSGHLGGWATLWSAEEMLDGQHQRMDNRAHARTAHKGLLQKRVEEDLCRIIPHVPPPPRQSNRSRDWTKHHHFYQSTIIMTTLHNDVISLMIIFLYPVFYPTKEESVSLTQRDVLVKHCVEIAGQTMYNTIILYLKRHALVASVVYAGICTNKRHTVTHSSKMGFFTPPPQQLYQSLAAVPFALPG